MKKLIIICCFFIVSLSSNLLNAQCGFPTMPCTITQTGNPGEVQIQYDLSSMTYPSGFIGQVNFHNTTTGSSIVWTPEIYNFSNPTFKTLTENGDYYAVAYTIGYSQFCWDSIVLPNFNVSSVLPICGIAAGVNVSMSANQATFNVVGSNLTGATYNWNFGDGTNGTGGPSTTHTYPALGTAPANYEISVSVSNGACADVLTNGIYLSNSSGGCHANFLIEPHPTNAGVYYGFNFSNMYDTTNYSYLWDFGDGTTSTLPYPSHTYSSVGTYNVCMTVSNSSGPGCSMTTCDSLNVIVKSGTTLTFINPYATNSIFEKEVKKLAIFPNPNQGEFTIELSSHQDKNSTLSIIDLQGRSIYSETHQINKGENQISINLNNKQAGIYFIKLDEQLVEKIIIE